MLEVKYILRYEKIDILCLQETEIEVNFLCDHFFYLPFWNFFLHQDRLSGDVPPHLAQPCYVSLGRALIWGLYPDWLRALRICTLFLCLVHMKDFSGVFKQ